MDTSDLLNIVKRGYHWGGLLGNGISKLIVTAVLDEGIQLVVGFHRFIENEQIFLR